MIVPCNRTVCIVQVDSRLGHDDGPAAWVPAEQEEREEKPYACHNPAWDQHKASSSTLHHKACPWVFINLTCVFVPALLACQLSLMMEGCDFPWLCSCSFPPSYPLISSSSHNHKRWDEAVCECNVIECYTCQITGM